MRRRRNELNRLVRLRSDHWRHLLRDSRGGDCNGTIWQPHQTVDLLQRFLIPQCISAAWPADIAPPGHLPPLDVTSLWPVHETATEISVPTTIKASDELLQRLAECTREINDDHLQDLDGCGRKNTASPRSPNPYFCFVTEVPKYAPPLCPESLRYLQFPPFWLTQQSGQPRPMSHFNFYLQSAVFCADCPSLRFDRLSTSGAIALVNGESQTFVNYHTTIILILLQQANPMGPLAEGEQMFRQKVELFDHAGATKPLRVFANLRVWCNWKKE